MMTVRDLLISQGYRRMCSKPPSAPKPLPPPEPLKDLDESQNSARDRARKAAAAAGGLASTNMTGGLGLAGVPLINQLGRGKAT